MSKKRKKSKKREDEEKLLYLALTFFLGPAVLGVSLYSLNFVGAGVGVFLEALGIWGLPEIHPYLKMVPTIIINWKSGNKTQQVEVNQSPNAQVNQAGRDLNVFNLQPAIPQPEIIPGLRVGFMAQGRGTSEILVFLEAANRGQVPVRVSAVSSLRIILPGNQAMTPLSDTWASDVEFPFELGPGRAFSIWRDARGFANGMKRNGYNGRVDLVVELRDEAGRQFRSGTVNFDVDGYANS